MLRAIMIMAVLGAMCLSASTALPTAVAVPAAADAAGSSEHGAEEDLAAVLLADVLDSDEWYIAPGLPAVHLPKGVTTHFLMLWIASGLVGGVSLCAFRRRRLKVTGAANFLEMLVVFVRDDIVYPVMGKERGEKWLPFFSTLLLFLLTVNYLGIIPVFRTATGNLNVTSAMAVMIMVLIFIVGVSRLGVVQFITNMYPQDVPRPIGIFVCFLEFFGMFIKSMVLSLRLFANMFAGHLAILSLLSLIFVLGPWASPISLPLAVCIYALEILVALIQAVVFTLLSCIFIAMASTAHEEEAEHAT